MDAAASIFWPEVFERYSKFTVMVSVRIRVRQGKGERGAYVVVRVCPCEVKSKCQCGVESECLCQGVIVRNFRICCECIPTARTKEKGYCLAASLQTAFVFTPVKPGGQGCLGSLS